MRLAVLCCWHPSGAAHLLLLWQTVVHSLTMHASANTAAQHCCPHMYESIYLLFLRWRDGTRALRQRQEELSSMEGGLSVCGGRDYYGGGSGLLCEPAHSILIAADMDCTGQRVYHHHYSSTPGHLMK